MSARGFKSVFMVGAVASAALGCYLVSLRVASERAALEDVETQIVLAQRDIRLLETEIGTRGRLAQLERWNVKVIQLSAPTADQFVDGGFALATLVKPERTPAIEAPIVLAAAPARTAPPVTTSDSAEASSPKPSTSLGAMMHVASYSRPIRDQLRQEAAIPAPRKQVAEAKPLAAPKKSVKPAAAATKPVKTAMADPLSPLPTARPKAKSVAPAAAFGFAANRPSKDPGSH